MTFLNENTKLLLFTCFSVVKLSACQQTPLYPFPVPGWWCAEEEELTSPRNVNRKHDVNNAKPK